MIRMPDENGKYKIAHISDLHCGSQYFVAHLMEEVIRDVNKFKPDILVVTGDITEQGFKQEFRTAKNFIDQIECGIKIVTPGNHDSRNVGYIHFEDFFGKLDKFLTEGPIDLVCVDSSEPDIDEGRVGREKYGWLSSCLEKSNGLRVVALHHHLIPVPGTGRERNTILDAGDFLRVLVENGVNVVLSGHRHVPHIWRFEDMFIINAGTASTIRVRGYTEACFNLIEYDGLNFEVRRKIPYGEEEVILQTRILESKSCKILPHDEG